MKLYLVQHGDALPKDVDPERGLSNKGKEDVSRVTDKLMTGGVKVTRIYHSGKKRAEETARILSICLAPDGEFVQREGIAPLDSVEGVAIEISNWQEDTMMVGHLPFMRKLVSLLVTGSENIPIVAFHPGSVVCLERDEGNNWVIAWMIRPELIRN